MNRLSYIRNSIIEVDYLYSDWILEISILRKLISSRLSYIFCLGNILKNLPYKQDITVNFVDVDDTLLSRFWQLQKPVFQDNRGDLGNSIIIQDIGIEKFTKKFYSPKIVTIELRDLLLSSDKTHINLLLTAGDDVLQKTKCIESNILNDIIVVKKSQDKFRAIVLYIIKLGFKPGKIIIYDDKPEAYSLGENGKVLKTFLYGDELLGELVVDKISLSQCMPYTISSINQTIYH